MASRYSIEAVFKATDQFTAPIKKMLASSKRFFKTLKGDFKSAQKNLQNFAKNVRSTLTKTMSVLKTVTAGLGIGTGLLSVGLVAVGKNAIQLASDLVEVQNVVDVTFGKDAEVINAWSKTALQSFGLSELQAKQFSSTLGAMMKSSGLAGKEITKMSMDLAGLAGDVASFYNLDIEEAFNKIRAGLSGETEPLKMLGIDMSVTNLQTKFGLDAQQWKYMTAAQKTMYRYKYLIQASTDSHGDFVRTMDDSLANQQRVLKTSIEQMLATLGTVFMPALIQFSRELLKIIQNIDVEAIKTKLEDFVNKIDFEKLIQNVKELRVQFLGWAKYIFNLVIALKSFLPYFLIIFGSVKLMQTIQLIKDLIIVLKAFGGIMGIVNAIMAANPFVAIGLAIGVLIVLIVLLVKNWDKVKAAVISFATTAYSFLMNLFEKIFAWMDELPLFAQYFTLPFRIAIDLVRTLLQGWRAVITAFTENGIKAGIIQIGKTILAFIITPLKNTLNLLSKIPGVGRLTSGASAGLNNFHSSLITPTTKEERATVTQRTETTTRGVVEIRDTTGKATMTRPVKSDNPQISFKSSGGF